jgi:hypothetical protein
LDILDLDVGSKSRLLVCTIHTNHHNLKSSRRQQPIHEFNVYLLHHYEANDTFPVDIFWKHVFLFLYLVPHCLAILIPFEKSSIRPHVVLRVAIHIQVISRRKEKYKPFVILKHFFIFLCPSHTSWWICDVIVEWLQVHSWTALEGQRPVFQNCHWYTAFERTFNGSRLHWPRILGTFSILLWTAIQYSNHLDESFEKIFLIPINYQFN